MAIPTTIIKCHRVPSTTMKFTSEIKPQGRIIVPAVVRQALALKEGDFVEVTVEVVKRGEAKQK